MKKLLSYIWPFIKKTGSKYNGVLELTLVNGQLLLDSKNANYSYGLLQKVLEKGLMEIDLKHVETTLLLGLGGGSVIQSLRKKYDYKGSIDAVEFDEAIIKIAERYFGINSIEGLNIIKQDAFHFVNHCCKKYDLIITDLFIDNKVPHKFYSLNFCSSLLGLLQQNGNILFNAGIHNQDEEQQKRIIDYFSSLKNCQLKVLNKVEGVNTVLIINLKNRE